MSKSNKVYPANELPPAPSRAEVVSYDELLSCLGFDETWSLEDTLKELIRATQILMIDKNYDGHGYEMIVSAKESAEKYVDKIRSYKMNKYGVTEQEILESAHAHREATTPIS